MAEFDYQWKYTLEKEDLENEEDKFECNEKRINEFLGQFKNKSWSFRKPSFKGKICLDAGCGPGRWTCALQKLNASKVDSFDLSEEAIARCKKINPDAYVFNIMELKENKIYDFVLSWGVKKAVCYMLWFMKRKMICFMKDIEVNLQKKENNGNH